MTGDSVELVGGACAAELLPKMTSTDIVAHQRLRADQSQVVLQQREWNKVAAKQMSYFEVTELNSIDSFQSIDSPEGTISLTSHESSHSSLSALVAESPKSAQRTLLRRTDRQSFKELNKSSTAKPDSRTEYDKCLRSEFSLLKSQCIKFTSRHNAGKANYLRLTLLPFLRKSESRLVSSETEIKLPQKVLSLWWSSLLTVAKSNFKHVSGFDRNAFYEAISSIIARPEWAKLHSSALFQELLTQTLCHTLTRCGSIASLTVAQAAFTGKVLAYSYMYIPGFAVYALKAMSIKPNVVRRLLNGKECDVGLQPDKDLSHLAPLVNARSVPSLADNSPVLTWLPKEQRDSWTRHFQVDTVLFASFFKHICVLQCQFLPADDMDPDFVEDGRLTSLNSASSISKRSEAVLLAAPGMLLILSKIIMSLDEIAYASSRGNHIRCGGSNNTRQQRSSYQAPASSNQVGSPSNSRTRIDLLRIFAVFREIIHCDPTARPHTIAFSRIFDRAIKAMVAKIRIHDMEGCVTVCNIAEEWFSSIFLVRTTRSKHQLLAHKQLVVDWDFWLSVIKKMLQSDNTHTEIRGLSFLFNIWPYLPNDETLDSNRTDASRVRQGESILRRTVEWILSPELWTQLFCHWSPLVRSYYHRLLCYRLASVGVDNNSWFLDVEYAEDLDQSRKLLKRMLLYTFNWCEMLCRKTDLKPETNPSLPLPRFRVGIQRFGPESSVGSPKFETNKARVYQFDVFDSAAYSTTNGEVSSNAWGEGIEVPEKSALHRSSSLVSKASLDSLTSIASVSSTSSTASNLSTTSIKTQLKRLTLSFGRTERDDSEGDAECATSLNSMASKSPDSKEKNGYNRNKWIKKWHGIMSRRGAHAEARSVKPATTYAASVSSVHGNKKSDKLTLNDVRLQGPPLLSEPIPEIMRPANRFIMVPTSTHPPARPALAAPRLPFSQQLFLHDDSFVDDHRMISKDLTYWNYGGRSLAEWNIEVAFFEHFAQQQKQLVDDSMEMFAMPFLVAEIPWRLLG